MEYTYRKAPRGESVTIVLDDFGFTVARDNQRESFAYSDVSSILISRNDNGFRAYLFPAKYPPVIIGSQSYSADGTPVDQSQAYSLFVRVLHHHLKEKSHAEYRFGSQIDSLWKRAAMSALLSFGISIAGSYMGVKWINPFVQALAIAIGVFAIIFLWYAGHLPKSYKPTDIPVRFLP